MTQDEEQRIKWWRRDAKFGMFVHWGCYSVLGRGDFFRQLNIVVHVNGKTVAKIDNLGRGGSEVLAPLNEYGMKQLKKGENP